MRKQKTTKQSGSRLRQSTGGLGKCSKRAISRKRGAKRQMSRCKLEVWQQAAVTLPQMRTGLDNFAQTYLLFSCSARLDSPHVKLGMTEIDVLITGQNMRG